MPQLPPLRRCLGSSERDHGRRVSFSTSKRGSVRPRPASPPSFSTPTSRSRRLGLSGRDDGGGAPLSASMCGPMPSPTRASVASLPTAGAVLSCRAHRASRWPTHTRSTLHPKKSACAWEERVLDVDKYAIMHCGVQVSRLHACCLSILRAYAHLRAASGLHLPRVSRSSIVVYPRVARCLHAIRDTGHLRAIWDLGWRRWQLQPERYYAMPGRRLAVMLSRSPRLAGDDPRLSIDALTSSLKPFELYAPLNAELLLELHHKAGMLKRALEFNWQMLLEDIGLWIPPTIYHIEHDDKPENEPEGPPLPPECNTELHTDYGGTAVRWGLTHHKESAADCCQACIDQAKMARPGALKCNIWVYCPSEYGCYSPDKYEHKHQECWLKQADHPRLNFKDRYPELYRDSHPTAPVVVPWMSGVITAM
uniref:Methionine aminopeptidase 1D chloroplastic/mitochondrial n=1 Tax=Zea mays TaxID=4577 RepID=A0A804PZB5_MAIZE